MLHPFRGADKEKIQEAVSQAADAVEAWMGGADVGELMQKFNKKAPKKPATEPAAPTSEETKENAQ